MTDINRHDNEENDGIDGISFLPDDIRTHILSFLTTKEAMQTCILSKRWITTWASVLDLNFNIREFGCWESLVEDKAAVVTKLELLMKSVLLKREASCVNRFQLWLDSRIYWPHTQAIVSCIGDVMKLGPRECLVEMGSWEKLNLNTGLFFTCASLIHLQLFLFTIADDYFIAIEPNSVNLPCLKTLNLAGVTMSNNSFKKLLLGCPVLEDLLLDKCYIDTIEICSKTLKKLVLHKCYDVKGFQISTPNLLYLDISVVTRIFYGFVGTSDILLLNILLLVHASICITDWCDEDIYITRGLKLIHSLSKVESLQLEFGCCKETEKNFSKWPIFNNLKCLKLVNLDLYEYDYDLALYFLHHSPKLQELTLTDKHGLVTGFVDEEITPEGPRDALVQRKFLKTVRIVGFKNDNGFVDQLISKLLTHIKIIGDIVIDS